MSTELIAHTDASIDHAVAHAPDDPGVELYAAAAEPGVDARVLHALIEGGAGRTPADNLSEWEQWRIVPRMFEDVSAVDTRVSAFGIDLSSPIHIAPSGGHRLVHPDGEAATARAASDTNTLLWLIQGSATGLDDIAAAGAPFVQQVYLPPERRVIEPFLDRAVAAGAAAIALTVDQPSAGNSHAFRADAIRLLSDHGANFTPEERSALSNARDVSLRDIEWLHRRTGLPVIVKGVLRAEDARRAVDAGAAALVVSNHGGRQIAGSITSAYALPAVADVVGGAALVFVDGGVRTATDVVRALALGADGVLIGRPVIRALATGEDSLRSALAGLRDDLTTVMALAGAPTVESIDRSFVTAAISRLP